MSRFCRNNSPSLGLEPYPTGYAQTRAAPPSRAAVAGNRRGIRRRTSPPKGPLPPAPRSRPRPSRASTGASKRSRALRRGRGAPSAPARPARLPGADREGPHRPGQRGRRHDGTQEFAEIAALGDGRSPRLDRLPGSGSPGDRGGPDSAGRLARALALTLTRSASEPSCSGAGSSPPEGGLLPLRPVPASGRRQSGIDVARSTGLDRNRLHTGAR